MTDDSIEDLVSELMVFVSFETSKFLRPKKFAVDRYMRTFLRSLTKIELEVTVKFYETNLFLDPDLSFKIEQASDGYDRYMANREKPRY